ncbi:hypothetical protein HNR25_003187 [Streptomonospora salina]|uniref:Schlafen AlbA-2 domain-containing protein n=1 Tax=Streptomonospora salina TaxID=104205 RepID=A0A841E8V9_9ACTN|nr:hypothetical protein [Streptomonospora salina]
MENDLAEALGTRKSSTLEFKREAKDRYAIRKAICALANDLGGNDGGDLLIGVQNDGTPYGSVDTTDAALRQLTDIRDDGKILDRPSMTVAVGGYRGEPVVHTKLTDDGGFREREVADFPFPALREACMNALMHRNYESSNAPVRIQWFDDRVEVSNPGGPYGQVRADNYDRVNDYRNPSLAGAMKNLGYVNRFGRPRLARDLAGHRHGQYAAQHRASPRGHDTARLRNHATRGTPGPPGEGLPAVARTDPRRIPAARRAGDGERRGTHPARDRDDPELPEPHAAGPRRPQADVRPQTR